MILQYCVVQRYRGRFQSEMPPEFYSNLRGTKLLPYLTKGEAKQVIQQIRFARSTEAPEIRTIRGRPQIIGVYTYSTTATTTNRELGAVLLRQPGPEVGDPFLATLIRMIEVGPREVRFEGPHLLQIIEKAESVFKQEPTLLEVSHLVHSLPFFLLFRFPSLFKSTATSTANTRTFFAGSTSTVGRP